MLEDLQQQGGIRTTTELNAYFARQVQACSLSNIFAWLADKGIIQKVPLPSRQTPKNQVVVDESVYYYDSTV